MAAVEFVNFGFKQFVTAVGIYAATNPLWPRTTFQWCAVILCYVMSLLWILWIVSKVQIFLLFCYYLWQY